MKTTKRLYRVSDGEATPTSYDDDYDPKEVVYVYTSSTKRALTLARAYDNNKIAPDNMAYGNKTIVAICDQAR